LVECCNAEINIQNNAGITPLWLVSWSGELEAVKYLVESCNADISIKTSSGLTALDIAIKKGRADVVDYLTILAS